MAVLVFVLLVLANDGVHAQVRINCCLTPAPRITTSPTIVAVYTHLLCQADQNSPAPHRDGKIESTLDRLAGKMSPGPGLNRKDDSFCGLSHVNL